ISTLSRIPRQLSKYIRGHDKPVWKLTFSPDGKRLASADEGGTVLLWNTEDMWPAGHPLSEHYGMIHSLSFNTKGDILATTDDERILRLWNTKKARVIYTSPKEEFYSKAVFSPMGTQLAAGMSDGIIRLFDTTSLDNSTPLSFVVDLPAKGELSSLAFSPDGRIMAAASKVSDNESTISLWDIKKLARIGEPFKAHNDNIWRIVFSSDSKILASGSTDNTTILWDVQKPEHPRRLHAPLTGHTDSVTDLAFSPDDRVIYSASADKSIRMWDTATGKQIGRPLTGHLSAILSMDFSNHRSLLASSDKDGTIIVWNPYAGNRLGTPIAGKFAPVRSVSFSHDGHQIASAGQDNNAILWDPATQQQQGLPLLHGAEESISQVTSLLFHPSQDILYTGSDDHLIRIWNTKTNALIDDNSMKHQSPVLVLALSNNGNLLASGDNNNEIILWKLDDGKPLHSQSLKGHSDAIWSLAFNKKDTILASGSDDTFVRLWDVKSGKPIGEPLQGHTGRVSCLAFMPLDNAPFSSETLFTASKDEIIRWDLSSSPPTSHPLPKFPAPNINSMAFSPDGRMLAIGGGKGVAFIDPMTGAPLSKSDNYGNPIWAVSFDPDGKTVVSGDAYGVVNLWNSKTGKRFGLPMEGHHLDVKQITQSLDGSFMAFSSGDNKVEVIRLDSSTEQIKPVELQNDEKLMAMIFHPDQDAGKKLITASNYNNGRITEWDLSSEPRIPKQITDGTGYIYSLAISQDGRFLAGGGNGIINIWDLSTNPPQQFSLPGHTDTDGKQTPVTSLAFHSEDVLVSGSRGELLFWDLVENKQPIALPVRENGAIRDFVKSIVFSPKETKFAAAWTRGDIILVDMTNKNKSRRLIGHTGPVTSLYFSHDEKLLASGSTDNTVRLWDLERGQPLGRPFIRHKEAVTSVAFSADDKKLITTGNDGIIMSWDLDVPAWKKKVMEITDRQLDVNEISELGLNESELQKFSNEINSINIESTIRSLDLLALKGYKEHAGYGYLLLWLLSLVPERMEVKDLNKICWFGTMEGLSEIVLPACIKAVTTAPSEDVDFYRDSRGIARATTSNPDIDGAIEDFQAYVTWGEQHKSLSSLVNKRKQWIRDLQAGRNPFDEETLHELRNERWNT
ncbi:WD40 repeat domain-containing protein, partial [bacterium]|nr:WD40 repeat domain-containing protein [bacterium]